MKMNKIRSIYLLCILIISTISCDECRDVDCPASPRLLHRVNIVDSSGRSVYGSSSIQFNKSELTVNNGNVISSFEDSILVLNQRFQPSSFTINYNDSVLTTVNINYKTVSPMDDCCDDFQEHVQTTYDNVPLCDTCEIAIIVI